MDISKEKLDMIFIRRFGKVRAWILHTVALEKLRVEEIWWPESPDLSIWIPRSTLAVDRACIIRIRTFSVTSQFLRWPHDAI